MSAPEPLDHLPLTDTAADAPVLGPDAAPSIDVARFELLSAYLDGEVTPDERAQVESWLAQDPAVQTLYANLTGVQMRIRSMPVRQAVTPEETLTAVMQRLDRRRRRIWVVSGSAIAATVTAAITAWTGGFSGPMPQLANQRSGDRPPLSIASSLRESPAIAPPQATPDEDDQPLPSVVERALIVE
jgi:anti-sigma factor RsiW